MLAFAAPRRADAPRTARAGALRGCTDDVSKCRFRWAAQISRSAGGLSGTHLRRPKKTKSDEGDPFTWLPCSADGGGGGMASCHLNPAPCCVTMRAPAKSVDRTSTLVGPRPRNKSMKHATIMQHSNATRAMLSGTVCRAREKRAAAARERARHGSPIDGREGGPGRATCTPDARAGSRRVRFYCT